jgi:phage baseplate assembly protein W
MKTIAVSNGDIQLNGGKIQFAIGSDKLVQDIQRWLEEPIGTGFTTPNFGSLLPSMIGGNQNSSTVSAVTNEIQRVLQLYQGQQIINLQTAQNAAQLSYWNKSEIIQTIQSVNVTVQNTSILASISLLTLANSSVNINLSIDNNGVSVTNG